MNIKSKLANPFLIAEAFGIIGHLINFLWIIRRLQSIFLSFCFCDIIGLSKLLFKVIIYSSRYKLVIPNISYFLFVCFIYLKEKSSISMCMSLLWHWSIQLILCRISLMLGMIECSEWMVINGGATIRPQVLSIKGDSMLFGLLSVDGDIRLWHPSFVSGWELWVSEGPYRLRWMNYN